MYFPPIETLLEQTERKEPHKTVEGAPLPSTPLWTVDQGLVAAGGRLGLEILQEAYGKGIFPWPSPNCPMLWFCPDPRGVIDFSELHIPKTLLKFKKRCRWRFSTNQAFEQVMRGCQTTPRPGQSDTWITEEVIAGYSALFAAGKALSAEVWEDGELIGGIYGVIHSKYASAESMFYRKSNASKLALLYFIESLQEKGYSWVDTQMVTEITRSFGAKEISRLEFLKRIGAVFL